jgi:alcohol dehydrogenase class IV
MQDRPTSIELLEAAADFVDREIVPILEGQRQFQSRVVANVMRIVAREIKHEDPSVRSEVRELSKLLAHPEPHVHSLDDLCKAAVKLNAELSERIQAGDADSGAWRAEVLALVRRSVEDKLRIANPRYLESELAARKTHLQHE